VLDHLAHEERRVLPLIEQQLTQAQWRTFLHKERARRIVCARSGTNRGSGICRQRGCGIMRGRHAAGEQPAGAGHHGGPGVHGCFIALAVFVVSASIGMLRRTEPPATASMP